MIRGRLWLVLVGVLVVALVGTGWWRRSQLLDEQDAARAARTRVVATLEHTRRVLTRTALAAGSLEADTVETQRSARELQGIGDDLAGQIVAVQNERDDAALSAWVSGGRVAQLHECLAGITRALNEAGVGDAHATESLGAVSQVCRAVSE